MHWKLVTGDWSGVEWRDCPIGKTGAVCNIAYFMYINII